MTEDSLIRVEHLYRYYGDHCAVRDVSFEIHRGEVLGFLGPNGAGKTTTMQILTGCLAPSAGRVWIHGIDLLDAPRRAKQHLGYLPEQPPLYRELTVDEYLRFCGRLHGLKGPALRKAMEQTKARCGLDGMGRRLIGNLSKGYQQRVGIAQAILHAPSVVVLDEPTVGLDPIQIREIRALIREIGTERSVILSTHILPEVQAVCDRVLIIYEGEIAVSERVDRLTGAAATGRWLLRFRNPPAIETLRAIDGVTGVEALGDGRVRLHTAAEFDVADALVARSVREGWGLSELAPERRDLEQVFMDLIHRDRETATMEAAS